MQNITVQHSLEFVLKNIPEKNAKILEVGCGKGDLARALMDLGHLVTAIDISKEAVEIAQSKGVEAQVHDVLEYTSDIPFDAVLFSQSLHHIHPLDAVMNKAKSLLGQHGKVLVDDFAIDRMDEKTANWFYSLKDILDPEENPGKPMERWARQHDVVPGIHNSKDMLKAFERNFGTTSVYQEPYLYRYFKKTLSTLEKGELSNQNLFQLESTLIAKEQISPLGLRITAKKYFSYLK